MVLVAVVVLDVLRAEQLKLVVVGAPGFKPVGSFDEELLVSLDNGFLSDTGRHDDVRWDDPPVARRKLGHCFMHTIRTEESEVLANKKIMFFFYSYTVGSGRKEGRKCFI